MRLIDPTELPLGYEVVGYSDGCVVARSPDFSLVRVDREALRESCTGRVVEYDPAVGKVTVAWIGDRFLSIPIEIAEKVWGDDTST